MGEWGLYGHPCGRYNPSVVRVPWFMASFDKRKTITEGELQKQDEPNKQVKDRLADLGYIDF